MMSERETIDGNVVGNRLNSISEDVIFVFGVIIFCWGGGGGWGGQELNFHVKCIIGYK